MARTKKVQFKDWIREERLNRGLSQTELSEKLGVTLTTLNHYENGKTTPNFKAVKSICDFFNIEPKELRKMIEEN